MTLSDKIAVYVERARIIWVVVMVGYIAGIVLYSEPRWLLSIPVFAIASYWVAMFIAATIVGYMLHGTQQDIDESNHAEHDFSNEEAPNEPIDLLELGLPPAAIEELRANGITDVELEQMVLGLSQVLKPVVDHSPEFGRLGDRKLYEWVKLQDPKTKKITKFEYEGPEEMFPDGIKDKDVASVQGILYSRPL